MLFCMYAVRMEQLSLETVIIVACVCGTVVLVLTIVLIVLCCQRNHDKGKRVESLQHQFFSDLLEIVFRNRTLFALLAS